MFPQIEKMNSNAKDPVAAGLFRMNNIFIHINYLSCSNPNHDGYTQIKARNLQSR
jgi:hypothetical protein